MTIAERLNAKGSGRFATGATQAQVRDPHTTPVLDYPATPAQVKFLRSLLAQRSGLQVEAIREVLNQARTTDKLSKALASSSISALKALPVNPAPDTADDPPKGPVLDCGVYTVETPDGHRTLRVTYQPSDADFAPGETVIGYLSGPDNESNYTSFGFLKGRDQVKLVCWKRHRDNASLLADTEQFLADPASALESKECILCGRKLTTPESLAAGIGPVCATRGL